MSGSEEENELFCFYGKPLEPYDEDSVPKRRPITVEDQIATDAQGRRRFHGAFTGGFSAGFFNTVGSLEGWRPKKSSRSEKSKALSQKPQDFMDDEDLGEDGFAPQVVKATSDYDTSNKKRRREFGEGPIPGEPVLHNLLTSGNETVGYMLLKNLRLKDRRKAKGEERSYGCQMPLTGDILQCTDENSYSLHEMYKEALQHPKSNTFGLGYSGLDKSHINLFSNQSKLVMTDRNNKKVSITGQAFGVGAFEEDDDDIYMKEDMSKYDFELVGEKQKKTGSSKSNLILDLFARSQKTPMLKNTIKYPPPSIPHSFTGKHKVKRSRFEPIPEPESPSTSKLNPSIRARYLGEEEVQEHTPSKPINVKPSKREELPPLESPRTSQSFLDSVFSDRFVSSSKEENVHDILEEVKKEEPIHGTEQMREAVRMKMFGPLTRETSDWNPGSLLCKRFNVPEPLAGASAKQRTRTKNIIFQYQKHPEEEEALTPGLKQEPEIPQHTGLNQESQPQQQTQEPLNTTIEPQDTEMKSEPPPEQQVVDITEKIDLEQQQDLFKAIFLSSSESEDEPEEPKTPDKVETFNKTEELKEAVLSENLLPKIQPLRQGLLSGIHKFTKPTLKAPEVPEEGNHQKEKQEENPDLYGPRVPERPVILEKKILEVSGSDDEWVEKSEESTKKKHKKQKSKHKKHKKEKKSKHID